MKGKINPLNKIILLSKRLRERGKTVGLVLGSFDILHMGHINLFRFAKKHADILIVGLDNDEIIKITKGNKRPINNYKRRSEFLSELSSVDYVFKIEKIYKHGDKKSFIHLETLLKSIKPDYVFTSVRCDELWKERKKLAESLGIKFLEEKSKVMHTEDILKILESEM